ncbi:nuclear transport factor 2 family protein [Acrocarpospora macrocephala]|uniref:Ketosteroid isomerase n=1 Tax=Acrocarpospora macrocephala TaxID=150177 RepID=A0A5M3WU39_9ACTN|nr:nuclear transport factor 2 family protein [Acrocarpospora macrocephala]GES09658.1 ketosteroid isomerase [Acrocarpospora macrocephala]
MDTEGLQSEARHDLAVLDRFYAAEMEYVAAGGAQRGASFDAMAACFHPEAVMRQGPWAPFPGLWEGIEGVERFFAVLSDTWSSAEGLDVTYFQGSDGAAVSMKVLLTSRATGRQVDAHLAQFITLDDGLIRDFAVFYLDPVAISRTCGLVD